MTRLPSFKSLFFLCMLATAPAFAQDDPELGETAPGSLGPSAKRRGGSKKAAPAPEPEPAPVVPEAPPPMETAASTSMDTGWEKPASEDGESEEKKGDTDHAAVVGSIGVGLLGMAEVPLGGAGYPGTGAALTAPVLGARYWFSERIGAEAGLGFSFTGGSVTVTGASDADNDSSRAFAFHAGAPISLASGKHYNLIAVPYLGLGFSSSTITKASTPNGDDIFGKGFLFEGGLRAGVEAQLGAIGLEGLALQITGGMRLRYETRSTDSPPAVAGGPKVVTDTSNIVFATSPGSTLGSAVAGTIAAIYYF